MKKKLLFFDFLIFDLFVINGLLYYYLFFIYMVVFAQCFFFASFFLLLRYSLVFSHTSNSVTLFFYNWSGRCGACNLSLSLFYYYYYYSLFCS